MLTALFNVLYFLKEQVRVLVCENLSAPDFLFLVLVVVSGRRHYESGVDHLIWILELIYVLNRINLLDRLRVKIVNHCMRADSDL